MRRITDSELRTGSNGNDQRDEIKLEADAERAKAEADQRMAGVKECRVVR